MPKKSEACAFALFGTPVGNRLKRSFGMFGICNSKDNAPPAVLGGLALAPSTARQALNLHYRGSKGSLRVISERRYFIISDENLQTRLCFNSNHLKVEEFSPTASTTERAGIESSPSTNLKFRGNGKQHSVSSFRCSEGPRLTLYPFLASCSVFAPDFSFSCWSEKRR